MNKPFRPPLLSRARAVQECIPKDVEFSEPPAKRRRISTGDEDDERVPTIVRNPTSKALQAPRKPLLVVNNTKAANDAAVKNTSHGMEGYYTVLW